MKVPHTSDLFNPIFTIASELISDSTYPWDILDRISDFILTLGPTLSPELYDNPREGVWIAKTAAVAPSAFIGSPCIIDSHAEIRHCAFIRCSAIVGKGAVVGNSCELKNCILFDGAQLPHFNYVGDSIVGHSSHMGAGAVTSNLKSDKSLITVKSDEEEISTGRNKLGAMLADDVEVGCNSVLCPGAIVGRNSNIYPLSRVRGVVPPDSIFKAADSIVKKH